MSTPDPTAPRVEARDAMPTPRTDSVAFSQPGPNECLVWMVPRSHGRQLERELNALTTELAAAKEEISDLKDLCFDKGATIVSFVNKLAKSEAKAAATASRLAELERRFAWLVNEIVEIRNTSNTSSQSELLTSLLDTIAATPAPAPADRARVEELEKDKARLDWLLHQYSYADGRTDAKRLSWGLSNAGRSAIDAALAARPASGDAGKAGAT